MKTEQIKRIIGSSECNESHYDWIKDELLNIGWREYYNGYNKNYVDGKVLPDGDPGKVIVSMIKGNFKCLINCERIEIYYNDKLEVVGDFSSYCGVNVRSMLRDIYSCIYERIKVEP